MIKRSGGPGKLAATEGSRRGQDRPVAALEGCQNRGHVHISLDGSSNGLAQFGVSNEDGAAYLPISEDELTVASGVPIFEAQLACAFAPCFGLPQREQIYLGHLQLRWGRGARIAQVASEEVSRGHVGLLHARRPEPVYAPLVLGDVTGGKDV